MFYSYIILSSKAHIFYFGYTDDLANRLKQHNEGKVPSTAPHKPWELIWYGAFSTEKEARDFERYLKTGSGKSFAYKRLVQVVLKKDLAEGRSGTPKL